MRKRRKRIRIHTDTPNLVLAKVSCPDICPIYVARPNTDGERSLHPVGRCAILWDENDGALDAYCDIDAPWAQSSAVITGKPILVGGVVTNKGDARIYTGGRIEGVVVSGPAVAHPSGGAV